MCWGLGKNQKEDSNLILKIKQNGSPSNIVFWIPGIRIFISSIGIKGAKMGINLYVLKCWLWCIDWVNSLAEHTPRQTQANSGMRPSLRPGYGTKGRPIALRANFFRLNISPQLSDLYHYDVEITPEKCPKSVKRNVVNEIINNYKQTIFQGHHPAFDGEKNLYSRIKLPVPVSFLSTAFSNVI